MSSRDLRSFWIRWADDGTITVGTGLLDSRQIMSWKDPNPHAVNYVSVSTGWKREGEWHFPKVPGNGTDVIQNKEII